MNPDMQFLGTAEPMGRRGLTDRLVGETGLEMNVSVKQT